MNTQATGNQHKFEFVLRGTRSRNWPCVSVICNGQHCYSTTVDEETVFVAELYMDQLDNMITLHYFNKTQGDTITDAEGNITADQSLELVAVRMDGILLENWVWNEGTYHPQYFPGFLRSNPLAPASLRSQLIWHFPGRFQLPLLPHGDRFWTWYQSERQQRVLSDLVDPTGQIAGNYRGMTDEDREIITEIKGILDV